MSHSVKVSSTCKATHDVSLHATTSQLGPSAPRAKRVEGEGDESKGVVAAVAETTEAAARTTVAATGLWRPFRFLARTGQKGVNKFTHSQRFLNAVRARGVIAHSCLARRAWSAAASWHCCYA